jgi:hypothetical protein
MSSLSEVVTNLALNPFAEARAGRAIVVDGHALRLPELLAALDAPPDEPELDWSSCDTCSDPGDDGLDPWPKAT